jgi:ADP-ribose pyrophosphatase YjhB (NUDIX family)
MKSPNTKWIDWAMELQALAQTGLTYSKDVYDIERFERIREISAEIMAQYTELDFDVVQDLFCNESGFQTPKLDSRAAIIQHNKILLVKENNNKWSLPGGWVDVNESVKSNIIKEVKEESGFNATPTKIIAVQDRNKHNIPPYPYGICKIFVLCEVDDSKFVPNIETLERNFFGIDELPELAEEKNSLAQIQMCFKAFGDPNWMTLFD